MCCVHVLVGKSSCVDRLTWLLNLVTFLFYSAGKSNPEEKRQTNTKRLQLLKLLECSFLTSTEKNLFYEVICVYDWWSLSSFQCKTIFFSNHVQFFLTLVKPPVEPRHKHSLLENSLNNLILFGNSKVHHHHQHLSHRLWWLLRWC